MTPEEAARAGNEAAFEVCHRILDRVGPGKEYRTIVGSMATSLLFHSYRLAVKDSKAKAVELLQVILDDVAHNVKNLSGERLRFTVEGHP